MCFVVTCWERADLLALVCGVFCEFVTFPLVSWVRCGTWLYRFLIFAPLLTLIHTWIKGEVGAVKPGLSPSVNILLTVPRRYFSRGSFMFFLSCVCYVFMYVCLYVLCGHLLGKGWPLGSRLWCLTLSLSLSHWYPGSGVVLDCIDSWSLHPYLLCLHLRLWYFLIIPTNYFDLEHTYQDFTTAGDLDCVAAVERLPALHYSVDFIFLPFGIMGFIVELWNY